MCTATEEGWLFLAVVSYSADGGGGLVVAAATIQRNMVIDALEMVWQQRRPPKGKLLFRNNGGSQYAKENFTQLLDEHEIIASMSRRGDC